MVHVDRDAARAVNLAIEAALSHRCTNAEAQETLRCCLPRRPISSEHDRNGNYPSIEGFLTRRISNASASLLGRRGARLANGVRGVAVAALLAVVAVGVSSAGVSRQTVAPANSSLPTISGTAAAGSTLTANPGTWTGSAPIQYQYQWAICDDKGNACNDIAGATSQTYQVKDSDKGNAIRVRVIASNADG